MTPHDASAAANEDLVVSADTMADAPPETVTFKLTSSAIVVASVLALAAWTIRFLST